MSHKNKYDELKNQLCTIADELKQSKKINDALYYKMFSLSYARTRTPKLEESIDILKGIQNTTTTNKETKRKHTVTEFKQIKELKTKLKPKPKKQFNQLELDEFEFNYKPSGNDILNVSNEFYKNINFQIPKNYDYINRQNEKKKTFNFAYNDEPLQLENLLYSIYNQQKHTFKIAISFAYALIKEKGISEENDVFNIKFKFFDATPNTRIISHPTIIDNKNDIDKLIQEIRKHNLIEKVIDKRPTSEWKFYEFLYVRFDVYQMTSPIGKAHNLPAHFTSGSNEKALVRFDGDRYNDFLCFGGV